MRKGKPKNTTDIESDEYKKQFLHEVTRLAIESVEKGPTPLLSFAK